MADAWKSSTRSWWSRRDGTGGGKGKLIAVAIALIAVLALIIFAIVKLTGSPGERLHKDLKALYDELSGREDAAVTVSYQLDEGSWLAEGTVAPGLDMVATNVDFSGIEQPAVSTANNTALHATSFIFSELGVSGAPDDFEGWVNFNPDASGYPVGVPVSWKTLGRVLDNGDYEYDKELNCLKARDVGNKNLLLSIDESLAAPNGEEVRALQVVTDEVEYIVYDAPGVIDVDDIHGLVSDSKNVAGTVSGEAGQGVLIPLHPAPAEPPAEDKPEHEGDEAPEGEELPAPEGD